jgi:hypothetical protein
MESLNELSKRRKQKAKGPRHFFNTLLAMASAAAAGVVGISAEQKNAPTTIEASVARGSIANEPETTFINRADAETLAAAAPVEKSKDVAEKDAAISSGLIIIEDAQSPLDEESFIASGEALSAKTKEASTLQELFSLFFVANISHRNGALSSDDYYNRVNGSEDEYLSGRSLEGKVVKALRTSVSQSEDAQEVSALKGAFSYWVATDLFEETRRVGKDDEIAKMLDQKIESLGK